MVDVVQLVRASDCGSECRGFESHLPPTIKKQNQKGDNSIKLLSPFWFLGIIDDSLHRMIVTSPSLAIFTILDG